MNGPSADYSPDPPGQVKAPKVTFGDGRTPGVQDHDPEPRWYAARARTGPTAAATDDHRSAEPADHQPRP